jgi:hypothetical protein
MIFISLRENLSSYAKPISGFGSEFTMMETRVCQRDSPKEPPALRGLKRNRLLWRTTSQFQEWRRRKLRTWTLSAMQQVDGFELCFFEFL